MKILKHVALRPVHASTGRTRHTFNGVDVEPPASLRIVRYDGDPGYYLLYLDGEGHEIADTYHNSIEDAMVQADWEFNVKSENWRDWGN